MKYLKNLNNHNDYTTFIVGADFAEIQTEKNAVVSYCRSENHVHYNPYIESFNSHDYVEIGGIKWATMNIGANSITDTGLYFQWGDTQGYTAAQVGEGEGKKYFSENDCIYYNDGSYTKYNEGDSKITLEASDDAVTAAWGGGWRMPTVSEFIALGDAVNTSWTTDYQGSGVSGLVCTDNTDNSKVLFFPACGFANCGSVYDVGSGGRCWSSSLDADCGDSYAYNFIFSHGYVSWQGDGDRYSGFPVRGVLDGSNN